MAEQIQPQLSSLENEWQVLEVATKEKGEKLFDANRGTLYQQSIEDVDSWVAELESQMVQAETVQVRNEEPGFRYDGVSAQRRCQMP